MTSIRMLALTHTVGYIIILSIMTIVTRWFWTYPQEQQLALEYQEREIASIQNAIRTFHENLTYLAKDYANFPEIRQLIKTPDIIDIERGKHEFDLVRYQLEYLAIADRENNILIGMYRTEDDSTVRIFSPQQKKVFKQRLNQSNIEDVVENFELFGNHSAMAVTHPVYEDDFNKIPIGRLIVSWKLHGPALQEISEIVQLDIKPSSEREISQSNKTDLYRPGVDKISSHHVRCFYDNDQSFVNCLTLYHDEKLIPKFLTFRILASILAFSIVPLMFFSIMLNYLVRPLEQSTRFLKSTTSKKDITPLLAKVPILELDEMRIAFNELVDVTLQQKNQLEMQSTTDALTQIPNRRAFDDEIYKTWSRMHRQGGSAALIMCDIDYFKLFNDHYGHLHGDNILKKVATTLHQFGRRTDEICARYGGEEFAIILSSISLKELQETLEAIKRNIIQLNEIHEESPFSQLTVSCGAMYIQYESHSKHIDTVQHWITEADQALYQAKDKGRNGYVISSSSNAEDA